MKASATSSACEEDRRTTRPLRAIAVGAIAALSAVWAFAVNAQTYPERPIRVIVPIAAGSVTDVIMRATASELAPRLGQPFVIENRGGASGIPGAQACAQAAPDGYTLCLVYHNTLSINPLLFNQLPYDPERDFTLITNLYLLVEALFVNSSLKSTLSRTNSANRVQSLVSTVFTFAVDAGLVEFNPCHRLRKRGVENVGRRVLSDAEIRLFWNGIVEPIRRVGLGLRLALLTGARIGEIARLDTAELEHLADASRAAWIIPGTRTKNKKIT
jgi:Tripartite tricarboxylate transporter family receptor